MMSLSGQLPKREVAAFHSIFKLYEEKNYKKALRVSEDILNVVPSHGDTLAMRALIFCQMKKKPESYDAIERALVQSPCSHIAWHVAGIIHRDDLRYSKALECCERAATFDPKNPAILRDLCQLQQHLRLFSKAIETRLKMLDLTTGKDTSNFFHLLAIASCYYANKEHEKALTTLGEFDKLPQNATVHVPSLISEVNFFRVRVMMESPSYSPSDAFAFAEKNQLLFKDSTRYKEIKAKMALDSANSSLAMQLYIELLDLNPENRSYIFGFALSTGECASDVYLDIANKYPSAFMPSVMYLENLLPKASEFADFARDFLAKVFRRGVPALYSLFKNICANQERRKIIEDEVLLLVKDFAADVDPKTKEAMWAHYFLAQLYDKCGLLRLAIKHNNLAIDFGKMQNEPENKNASGSFPVEFLLLSARIHKHAGKLIEACNIVEEASKKEPKDKYIATKASKYALRLNNTDLAHKLIQPFMSPQAKDLIREFKEFQYTWYFYELGMGLIRSSNGQDNLESGLENLRKVLALSAEMQNEEYFFHSYSLRKGTLSTYVDLLSLGNTIFGQGLILDSAVAAIRVLLATEDCSSQKNIYTKLQLSTLATSVAKLDLERGSNDASVKRNQQAGNSGSAKNTQKPSSAPKSASVGARGGSVSHKITSSVSFREPATVFGSPFDEALSIFLRIDALSHSDIRVRKIAFKIFFRQKKWLLALRELKKIYQMNPGSITLELGHLLRALSTPGLVPAMFSKTIFSDISAMCPEISDFESLIKSLNVHSLRGSLSAARIHSLGESTEMAIKLAKAWVDHALEAEDPIGEQLHYFGAIDMVDEILCEPLDAKLNAVRDAFCSGLKQFYAQKIISE